jgi:hypothetical protein
MTKNKHDGLVLPCPIGHGVIMIAGNPSSQSEIEMDYRDDDLRGVIFPNDHQERSGILRSSLTLTFL